MLARLTSQHELVIIDTPPLNVLTDAASIAAAARDIELRHGRLDILAANRLGAALYSPLYTDPAAQPMNSATWFSRSLSASPGRRSSGLAAGMAACWMRDMVGLLSG